MPYRGTESRAPATARWRQADPRRPRSAWADSWSTRRWSCRPCPRSSWPTWWGGAADAWGYTLVLRFNSRASEAVTPNSVVGELQRQVVYHRPEDDITKPVIEYLNKQFLKQSPAPRTGALPVGATKTQTKTKTKTRR